MAKLTGPLFSLGASGTIGKTLTFGNWKGIHTSRQRVDPTNPKSAAQTAQRNIMSTVVAFWRAYVTGTGGKSSWNRDATASGKAQSGFNAFTSAATKIAAQDPEASMVVGVDTAAAAALDFSALNLDDGATGDESDDFTLNYGSAPSQMLYTATDSLVGGTLSFDVSGEFESGDTIYAQIVKTAGDVAAAKRSGIFQIELTS
jgi:hypothetical protein